METKGLDWLVLLSGIKVWTMKGCWAAFLFLYGVDLYIFVRKLRKRWAGGGKNHLSYKESFSFFLVSGLFCLKDWWMSFVGYPPLILLQYVHEAIGFMCALCFLVSVSMTGNQRSSGLLVVGSLMKPFISGRVRILNESAFLGVSSGYVRVIPALMCARTHSHLLRWDLCMSLSFLTARRSFWKKKKK